MNANRQRVDRIADSLNRHDWDAYRRQFAPDLVVRAPGVTVTGRDTRVKWVQDLVEAFPDGPRHGDASVLRGGLGVRRTCVRGNPHGTHGFTVRCRPTDERAARFPYCLVLRVDGEVAELHEYFDQLQLMAQLGLLAQA